MALDRLRSDKVRRTRRVLFDSSFLISVMEHPTPWQGDIQELVGRHDGVVLQPIESELRRLADRGGRESRFARLALGLIDRGTLRVGASAGSRADEELVSNALEDGAVVATVDGDLIRQLRASHVAVLSLRRGRVELLTPQPS